MDKRVQFHLWYVIAALIGIVVLQQLWQASQQFTVIPYSQYLADLKAGNVDEVRVSGDYIQGQLKTAPEGGTKGFVTTRVPPDIAGQLEQYHVKFSGQVQSSFLSELLSWVVPTLLFFGLWMFLFRRLAERQGLGGGFMAVGRSKAKVYVETDTKVTFDDVAGVDEAKEELQEVVAFLKNPDQYGRLGARVPKGVLLVGPPGTGKTLLARAVAGEAAVPFFSINGSEFVEMFVGVGAARVRDLFEQARAKAPAIIFIDELDALGRARGAFPGIGGHDEKEQTLNQLLSELDGFDSKSGLVLLAATNRPEILDPALLRAGRFDRQVLVDRPDKGGRIDILKVHLKGHTLGPDVDPEKIAALTPGFTGADLANLVNEAALIATRRRADAVTMDDFTNAVERIVAGLEKRKRLLSPKERNVVAHHEMGHAIAAMVLPGVDVVHKVSIIPRGIGALGYTIQRPTEDRFLMTREELENRMAVLLGGRAAERIFFQHTSTGAADDLAKVTEIARDMVMRFGMAERLGPVSYEGPRPAFLANTPDAGWHERRYSDETAHAIDLAVQQIVEAAFERTVALLERQREVLEHGARLLLEKETLDEADLRQLKAELRPAADAKAAE
ncbi:MAG TPA: ATP-dependent zinc metalloprotease FtsH [Stellaceae bacterium]|nr:ATP-dependent zinc metalloprotease FtsH [Stellaceae bacterium]